MRNSILFVFAAGLALTNVARAEPIVADGSFNQPSGSTVQPGYWNVLGGPNGNSVTFGSLEAAIADPGNLKNLATADTDLDLKAGTLEALTNPLGASFDQVDGFYSNAANYVVDPNPNSPTPATGSTIDFDLDVLQAEGSEAEYYVTLGATDGTGQLVTFLAPGNVQSSGLYTVNLPNPAETYELGFILLSNSATASDKDTGDISAVQTVPVGTPELGSTGWGLGFALGCGAFLLLDSRRRKRVRSC